ncbi:DUF4396 domain-containing protein [Thalassotalea crassostreae]|uniref:DUF4396 domain-containing protein n=1 Tax=Thalassotalea crassostreae TaxID=1763536 RepID=UPI000A5F2C2B|nr:DUF4396 domain-containing protein [Thalassotalea crassostreae]
MSITWTNRKNWIKSAHNTKWCLIGCAIGDFGTIGYFQYTEHSLSTATVMMLAMMNGLITSVLLEMFILIKNKFSVREAFKTALGMSFISMLAMEAAMNLTDYALTGGAILTWWVIPIALFMGFITPWPYNYWRLEKHGKSCH